MLTQQELKSILKYNPKTGKFRWIVKRPQININDIAGSRNSGGYILISINNKKYSAHRLVWLYMFGGFPEKEIDHINNIKDDNRLENLRECSSALNKQNLSEMSKSNSTGLLGSYFHKKSGKYMACIQLNKKLKYLGLYETALEAHERYIEEKIKIHEFYSPT